MAEILFRVARQRSARSCRLLTASRALSTGRKKGFFELRADHVLPGKMHSYLDEIERTADSRKRASPGLLGMWKTEIGGSTSVVI